MFVTSRANTEETRSLYLKRAENCTISNGTVDSNCHSNHIDSTINFDQRRKFFTTYSSKIKVVFYRDLNIVIHFCYFNSFQFLSEVQSLFQF